MSRNFMFRIFSAPNVSPYKCFRTNEHLRFVLRVCDSELRIFLTIYVFISRVILL